MSKTFLSVLMATALISPVLPTAAAAQSEQTAQNGDRERSGAWQRRFGNGGEQPQREREARPERTVQDQPRPARSVQDQPRREQPRIDMRPADVRQDMRMDRRDGDALGRGNRGEMNRGIVQSPIQQPPVAVERQNRVDGGVRSGNWQRGDRDQTRGPFNDNLRGDRVRGDRVRGDINRIDTVRDDRGQRTRDPRFDRNQDGRVDRDWDRNQNGVVDRRFDRNRDGNLDQRFDRNRDGTIDRRFDRNQNGRVDQRFGQIDRNWNRNWRGDNRYNWQNHRNQYRSYYRQPRYYNPYGNGYGYQRFSVGIYLNSLFFSNRYWINDPYEYRLPQAPYGYRWVRYYDDVILVDQRNGYVVDVIHNFFW